MKEEFSKNKYDSKYKEFLSYFEKTWIKKHYSVGKMDVTAGELIDYFSFYDQIKNQPNHRYFATNNGVEGYNNRMKNRFGKERGPIQHWVDIMVEEIEY